MLSYSPNSTPWWVKQILVVPGTRCRYGLKPTEDKVAGRVILGGRGHRVIMPVIWKGKGSSQPYARESTENTAIKRGARRPVQVPHRESTISIAIERADMASVPVLPRGSTTTAIVEHADWRLGRPAPRSTCRNRSHLSWRGRNCPAPVAPLLAPTPSAPRASSRSSRRTVPKGILLGRWLHADLPANESNAVDFRRHLLTSKLHILRKVEDLSRTCLPRRNP